MTNCVTNGYFAVNVDKSRAHGISPIGYDHLAGYVRNLAISPVLAESTTQGGLSMRMLCIGSSRSSADLLP